MGTEAPEQETTTYPEELTTPAEKITTPDGESTTIINEITKAEETDTAKQVFKRSVDPHFDVVCPQSEDGSTMFVPHPTECNLYYICVGKMTFLMQCPGDLYFDLVLNVCNWPDLVDCEPQTTENPKTTTIENVNTTSNGIQTTSEITTTNIL